MNESSNPQATAKKKILVVDDDSQIALVFQGALNKAGFDAKIANNGAHCFEALAKETFDLVLLDEMMPDMQGNDILQKLKTDPATKNLKVAMITNFSKDEMVKEAYDRGAVEYILKYQVTPDDLVEKVNSLLSAPKEVAEV